MLPQILFKTSHYKDHLQEVVTHTQSVSSTVLSRTNTFGGWSNKHRLTKKITSPGSLFHSGLILKEIILSHL